MAPKPPTARTNDSDQAEPLRPGEVAIDVSRLRPGVHIRMPVGWMNHPFMLNSFVITSAEQIAQIAALKLPHLFCDLSRCTAAPVPQHKAVTPTSPEEVRLRIDAAAHAVQQIADKQARAAAMDALRARLDVAQGHYANAAKEAGVALRDFERDPQASVEQFSKISTQSTSVLFKDADSVLALIAERGRTNASTGHAMSVMTLALLLGKQARLPEAVVQELGIAALLHDIGKATIDISLLRKTEGNKFEIAAVQAHCRLGHEAALKAGCVSHLVSDAILCHHERSDGSGYPAGLAGAAIPLAARVIAIVNRFDNLTNPIDPRRAMSPSSALATMWSRAKAGYDTTLLQLFVRAMGVYPPGSLVELSNGHCGVVVASAATESPLRPQVLVYDPNVARRHALIVDLALDESIKIARSLQVHERSEEEVDYLLPRRKLSWMHMSGE